MIHLVFMTVSIQRRLQNIKKLLKLYYSLARGELIEHHTELLRVFDIRGSKHDAHPHKMLRVYISRRSLKHFVESRKLELEKYHTQEKTLESICFAIDSIQKTIINFDTYEFEPPKHFYLKDFSSAGKPFLRILLELKDSRLEIISIHFKERRQKIKISPKGSIFINSE